MTIEPLRATWSKISGNSTVSVEVLIHGFSSTTVTKDRESRTCPVAIVQDLTDNSLRYVELKFLKLNQEK